MKYFYTLNMQIFWDDSVFDDFYKNVNTELEKILSNNGLLSEQETLILVF